MALTVEDGSGVAGANAYQSIADIAAYAQAMSLEFSVSDVPKAEAAARRAARWLDATYRTRLPGSRRRGRDQGLEWPRTGAYDTELSQIPVDVVPVKWLEANSEVAVRELAAPGSLSPDVVVGAVEKSVSVAGAISVTYASEGGVVESQVPVLTTIDNLLSGLILVGSGRSGTVFLKRA